MPPKERQSAKKGGRISKAEKERLQREADEQKLKEIEEARIIAEHEEQERLERERIEQEKQELLELKDRERREDELNELRRILDENHTAVVSWESDCREKAKNTKEDILKKWDRYMRCDGSPDPSVQTEINSFISLWREDSETQIQRVLEKCALALQLTDELDFLLSDSPELCVSQQYQETLLTLQNLIHCKLDKATEELLKCAKSHIDIETGNMQTVIQDVNITLCLWANFIKKTRNKGVQFHEAGLSFELPKSLAMSDVAVRILQTRYDHLSHYSEREQIKNKKTMMTGAGNPTEISIAEQADNIDGDEAASPKQVEEEQRSSAVSVSSHKEGRKSSSINLLGGEESQTETMAEELTTAVAADQNGSPSAPDPMIDSSEVHIMDLQQYTPLGGVFYFDAFHIPPQSHIVKGWEMRELLETGLQIFPYPPEQSGVQSSTSVRLDESGAVAFPPVGVSIALPDSIMFLEEPQVARWDPIGQHWRTDCISETSYDAGARSISFQMNTFYTFTLLQESYINMPFQSWELRPLGQDSALFTITGALFETSITIKGKECMLHMENAKELDHLLGKWMSPSALQKAMKRAGINIFVNEYSDKYVSINSKDPLIEHAVYEQMALMSSAVAFSWSRWNAQCGQEHLVLQACEQLEAEPVSEEAWSLYLLGAQRSQRLKMKEDDDSFSPELAEGSEFHSTFLHMLRQDMSGEGQKKVRRSQYLYTDVVQRLLCATRVLTYS